MKYRPHKFQLAAIDHAVEVLRTASPGTKQLYAAPTGVGKSVIELQVQEACPDTWIVTPRDEIISGMMDKLGAPDGDPMDYRITTPVRLRNRLMNGQLATPRFLIVDEAHHAEAETYQQIDLLTGLCPSIAYTATPYRGSPRSTRNFRERWGEPLWIITYEEAEQEGYISLPTFEVLPLVDDDIIDVSGGEFEVTSIESATMGRLGDLAEHCRQWHDGTEWDRPTVFACPSSECCYELMSHLNSMGMFSLVVSASTPKDERRVAFDAVCARTAALLHINIVSEGVDLPLRRLVDLAPTLSPVRWMQQLGRITRPAEDKPEYVCANRNLMRHAYALEGCVPTHAIVEGEKKFPPTQRPHTRVLGLEAIGRFKPVPIKLLSGAYAFIYSISVANGPLVVEYCVLVHPTMEPVWAVKTNMVQGEKRVYGSWVACEPPNDVRGFASIGQRELSDKQRAWWNRGAARVGLDPEQEVSRKNFQALPVLCDLGVRLT